MSAHHRVYRRLAILTEGGLDIYRNKTAMGLLRFRPEDVVCVIDSKHAGWDIGNLAGIGQARGQPRTQAKQIPIVSSMAEALLLKPEWVVIGVATPGGYLPHGLRPHLYEAIQHRVGIISGLHDTLRDPNLVSMAARYAVELVNIRTVDDDEHVISTGRARGTRALRVLTVGTDANIGKTTTTMQLELHLRRQGINARFAATGQDGILITGSGVCIDRQISDFAGGSVERLVLRQARSAAIVMIEGQNSILSPCYSGTALSVLHGSCPDAMILCHAPTRTHLRHTDVPVPSLATYIQLYEAMLAPIHPGKVVAVALNTLELSADDARACIAQVERDTGLPVADAVRDGDAACTRLVAPILAMARQRGLIAGKRAAGAAGKTRRATVRAGQASGGRSGGSATRRRATAEHTAPAKRRTPAKRRAGAKA